MKKTSYIFIIIGIIILAAAIYAFRKPQEPAQTANSSASSQNSPASEDQDQPVQIVVNYNDKQPFTAQEYQVTEGQKVDIKVTSTVADELHFHGYDLHIDLTPNTQGTIEFTADKTGRFIFELESRAKTLGAIDVNPK